MAAVPPIVEVSWAAGPLTVSPTWTDESGRVLEWSMDQGRDDVNGRFQVSKATVILRNDDRRFEKGYALSALYPNVKRRRGVRIRTTATGGVWRGSIDRLELSYPNKGRQGIATFKCVDLLGYAATVGLENPYVREVLLDTPDGYWRLDESSGTVAADQSGNGRFAVYYGVPTYGQSDPITDEGNGAVGVNTTTAGVFMDPALAITGTGQFWIEGWILKTGGTTDTSLMLWRQYALSGTDSVATLEFGTNNAGNARIYVADFVASTSAFVIGATDVTDGAWHHLVATRDSGGTLRLYVDGVTVGTPVAAGSINLLAYGGPVAGYDPTASNSRSFVIDELASKAGASLSAARVTSHYDARNAGLGETSSARLGRIMAYIGIPAGLYDLPAGLSVLTGAGNLGSQKALEAIRDVEVTEAGAVFIARDGTLSFRPRNYAWITDPTSNAAYSDAPGSGDAKFTDIRLADPVEDLANVVRNSRRNGTVSVAISATSVVEHGETTLSLSTISSTEAEALSRAFYDLNRRSDPPSLKVDSVTFVVTSANASALLERDVWDRVTVSFQPPGGGAAFSLEALITGRSMSYRAKTGLWRVTYTLNAIEAKHYWRVNTVGWGELGVNTYLAFG